jgi:hypothetical protein
MDDMKRLKNSLPNHFSARAAAKQAAAVSQAQQNAHQEPAARIVEIEEGAPQFEKSLTLMAVVPDLHHNLLDEVLSARGDESDQALEARVVEALRCTRGLEDWNSIMRGAYGYEFRKRSARRLAGGHGQRDDGGVGLRRKTQIIADACGVDLKTVEDDVTIYENLVGKTLEQYADEETIREKRTVLIDKLLRLPRSFNLLAARRTDPAAAQEMGLRRRAEQTRSNRYTYDNFKAELAVRFPRPATKLAKSKKQGNGKIKLCCTIAPFEYECYKKCEAATGKTLDQLIALAGGMLWTALQKDSFKIAEAA